MSNGTDPAFPGWPKIKAVKISIGGLMKLAAALTADDDPPNIEYERAIAELITDAAGLPMDYKSDVAREIGMKWNVARETEMRSGVAIGDTTDIRDAKNKIAERIMELFFGKEEKAVKGARPKLGDLGSRSLEP